MGGQISLKASRCSTVTVNHRKIRQFFQIHCRHSCHSLEHAVLPARTIMESAKRCRLTCPVMPADGFKVRKERSAEHEVGSESPEKRKLEMDDLWLQLKRQTEDMENHIRRLVSCDNESSLAQAAAKVPKSVGALGAADEEATPRHKKIKVTSVAMAATEHPSLACHGAALQAGKAKRGAEHLVGHQGLCMGSEISKTRFQRKHIQLDQPSICCEEVHGPRAQ